MRHYSTDHFKMQILIYWVDIVGARIAHPVMLYNKITGKQKFPGYTNKKLSRWVGTAF